MVKKPPKPPTPSDLREAREPPADEGARDAHTYCHELSCYASRDDYHWGFRIYRTAYPPACTDSDFDRAIQVLNEYIRYSVFETSPATLLLAQSPTPAPPAPQQINPNKHSGAVSETISYRTNNSSMERRRPKSKPSRRHGSNPAAPA